MDVEYRNGTIGVKRHDFAYRLLAWLEEVSPDEHQVRRTVGRGRAGAGIEREPCSCAALPCAEGSDGGRPMPSAPPAGYCGNGDPSAEGGPPLPPTCLETLGAFLGFAAAAAVLLIVSAGGDASDSSTPSAEGDVASFLGAAMAAVFLIVGRRVRRWMPLFLYATTINAIGAVVATAISLALDENATFGGTQTTSAFGYFARADSFPIVALLALGPSLLGHTCFYCSLSHLEPLAVSVVLLLEPITGSLVGWAVGEQGVPDVVTVAGGISILVGALLVTMGGRGAKGPCGEPKLRWVDAELPSPSADWATYRDDDVIEAYRWERLSTGS